MLRAIIIVLSLAGMFTACADDSQSPDDFKEYEGPIMEATDVELFHSDSAVVIVRLTADRQLQFGNDNQEFPEGIYIEFFENDEIKSASIRANHGYFDKNENLYTATGDVVVQNFKSGEKLETEVLYWEPNKKEIHTDRYVEITTDGNVLMGEGLKSDESFTNWQILKPKGTLPLGEEQTLPNN
ncbi:LPS export ABC transporter periplasmic protein LptC [Catalinimonas niigatensis]|uniref:LPS export ABC transporter periplasmic protein LptC n=1 Tax=Catalinimonas niigatensis TaxID=1397264 RepID=UPI002665728B|nr:LPS export ABC transporter periplasmic protein LptC [Catalinimonas niigatensis]WPP48838.1 LPS export ABC transporter periplasmic protein LptC [Catalinimonas niigatensis]